MPDPASVKPDDWDEEAPRLIEDPAAERWPPHTCLRHTPATPTPARPTPSPHGYLNLGGHRQDALPRTPLPRDAVACAALALPRRACRPDTWEPDEPLQIPDPTAEAPADWDSDEDGEWEAPLVPNPKCKPSGCGEWKRPQVANPAYKGKWVQAKIDNPAYVGKWAPRQIDNPAYYYDAAPHDVMPIGGVGIELWTMQVRARRDLGRSPLGALSEPSRSPLGTFSEPSRNLLGALSEPSRRTGSSSTTSWSPLIRGWPRRRRSEPSPRGRRPPAPVHQTPPHFLARRGGLLSCSVEMRRTPRPRPTLACGEGRPTD